MPMLPDKAELANAKIANVCFYFLSRANPSNTLVFLILTLWTVNINAQPEIPRPVSQTFQPIELPNSTIKKYNNSHLIQQQPDVFQNSTLSMGANADDIIRQTNQNAMRITGVTTPGQSSYSNQQQQLEELHQLSKEDNYNLTTQSFQKCLKSLLQLNPDSFSITKAVYLSEAPFYNTPPPFEVFENAIKLRAIHVKQILKREGLSINNNSAVNYAIQKLFSQDNIYHDAKTNKDFLVKKISYDFDDFYGEKDWTKMFVTKLLQTNSGQCHSLPLLYLCIAEQLHAKAYLSLAPNHSFIQYFDSKGVRRNFETTNGNLVSISWLMQSDAISSMALKNRTYLNTLSQRKLFAECLADFKDSYIAKNGYDNFVLQLNQKILSIDSTNINALMTNANFTVYQFDDLLHKYNNPPKKQLHQYPQLEQAYYTMVAAQQKVDATGYQEMPKEQYLEWLKSIEAEKQKQRYKDEQEKRKREIEYLKKMKPAFSNTPKG